MQTTGNLSLKKPEGTDLVDIDDLNGNMDILDTVVTGKVDKVTGKQLSTNDYTAAEKTKLTGIATGANNYTHPNHTGDVTSTADGATAIAAGVIVDADVNATAGIAWTKLNKTGASLADLTTRSAGDLTSGTLPAARLPAITGDITMAAGTGTAAITAGAVVNADVNVAAAIDATKIGTGIVTNTEFAFLDGVTSAIQSQLNTKTAIADYVRQPAYATTAGTAAAYTVTLSPAPTSLAEGFGITIVMHIANTASPTLNVNGLGAIALKDQKGVAYAAGKLILGKPYMFRKVGTDFLADSSGGAGDAIAGDIRAGKKATTDSGDIVGTLAVQTGGTVTPGASAIIKSAGIYDTAISVSAVAVPAANVLAGTTIAGTAGTMVRRTGGEFPGYQRADSAMGNSGRVHLYAPPGAYIDLTADNGGGHFGLFHDDPDFVASNFRSDKNVLGMQGSMPVITIGADPAQGLGQWPDGGLAVYPSEGYRKGGAGAGEIKVSLAQLQATVSGLTASNIKSGVTMMGVAGTLAERKYASGTTVSASDGTVRVTGLAFNPMIVAMYFTYGSYYYAYTSHNQRWSFGMFYPDKNGTMAGHGQQEAIDSFYYGFSNAGIGYAGVTLNWYCYGQ